MSNILLARIDDRLIHGQVMTSWVRFVKSKNILIIDDETYHDTFIRSFITMVVPRGIQIQVLIQKQELHIYEIMTVPDLFYWQNIRKPFICCWREASSFMKSSSAVWGQGKTERYYTRIYVHRMKNWKY